MRQQLYSDAGMAGRNPSHMGAWAWCLVERDSVVAKDSGVLLAAEGGWITNNFAELYAAVQGLLHVGLDWNGEVWTDSQVTFRRLLGSNSFVGIPDWLKRQVVALRTARRWRAHLLAGHPTKKELAAGVSSKGVPVSRWNVLCDKMCADEIWKATGELANED